MSKNNKYEIDELLFKPLILSGEEGDRLVIIYEYDYGTSKSLSIKGKPVVVNTLKIHVFDITTSLLMDQPVLTLNTVVDIKKFKSMIQLVDPKEYFEEITNATSMLYSEMNNLSLKLQSLARAFTTLKHLKTAENHDKGAIMLATQDGSLAQIAFSSVTGESIKLNHEDLDKIGSLIYDIIMHNLSVDTKDVEQIRKLKAEIEFKVIEALPISVKAQDIKINMDPILNQIRMFQDESDPEN